MKDISDKIHSEFKKCMDSPYYFATNYLKVNTVQGIKPYETVLSEEEFNKVFKEIEDGTFYSNQLKRKSK